MVRIGVDVGGTNTDAVVMAGRDILGAVKVPTSSDVTTGLMQALRENKTLKRSFPAAEIAMKDGEKSRALRFVPTIRHAVSRQR